MREIKFRAYDKVEECMIYKGVGIIDTKLVVVDDDDDERAVVTENRPNFVEVMQFTGLTDKNGVEIYEEDIVKHEKMVGEITMGWGDDAEAYGDSYGWCWGAGVISSSEMFKRAEVIGNIYENPELLK